MDDNMKYKKPTILSLKELDEEINKYGVEFSVSGPNYVDAGLF